jgi:acyl-CoA synthetase (AMP-forming)/AMP-acid ligase II
VLALARGLLRLGIHKGDRVGILAPNCPERTIVQYAAAEIGAILVPVNPAYRTDELRYVINQAGIRLLVAAASFKANSANVTMPMVRAMASPRAWSAQLTTLSAPIAVSRPTKASQRVSPRVRMGRLGAAAGGRELTVISNGGW